MWGLKRPGKAKSSTAKPSIINRRGEKADRRAFGPPTQFPFIDGNGKLVKVDRRTVPDRRLANIQVKEDHLYFDKSRFTSE